MTRLILSMRHYAANIPLLVIMVCVLALSLVANARAGFIENLFAPKPDLWEQWTVHDPRSTREIDHSAWDRWLKTYVMHTDSGANRVAYGEVTRAGRARLSGYLQHMAGIQISGYSRKQQLAYWINLYNALTVEVVLQYYPMDSIRDIDIGSGLFADGPWNRSLIVVEGQPITLNAIEHRILRPIWHDPRIHYAINCAALGGPNLQRQAFTAANTNRLMDKGAQKYINSPRGARVTKDGRLVVSSIYEWFQEDFGGSDAGVIRHLKKYANEVLAARLNGIDEIAEDHYDWKLNDATLVSQ